MSNSVSAPATKFICGLCKATIKTKFTQILSHLSVLFLFKVLKLCCSPPNDYRKNIAGITQYQTVSFKFNNVFICRLAFSLRCKKPFIYPVSRLQRSVYSAAANVIKNAISRALSSRLLKRPAAPPWPAFISVLNSRALLLVLYSRNLATHFIGSKYCT